MTDQTYDDPTVSFYDGEPVAVLNMDAGTLHPTIVDHNAPAAASDPAQSPLVDKEREQLLIQAATNLDADARPHFLRVTEGRADICGQDGQPWPCDTFVMLDAKMRKATGQAPDPTAPELVNLDDVAAALGMNREQLEASMRGQEKTMAGEIDPSLSFPDTGR